jgi:hypothetical protein
MGGGGKGPKIAFGAENEWMHRMCNKLPIERPEVVTSVTKLVNMLVYY